MCLSNYNSQQWRRASCALENKRAETKTGMCLFDGSLEIRVRLGGKWICQRCEWIIAIDAVQRWHNFQSPIHLSVVCVCARGGKARRVTGSKSVDEVLPWRWARAQNKRGNHTRSFSHWLSLHVSVWQVEPRCASSTAHGAVRIHYNNMVLLFGLQEWNSDYEVFSFIIVLCILLNSETKTKTI